MQVAPGAVFALAVLAGLAGAFACSSTATTGTVLPITGITIPAEAITNGRGCGTGATEVFRYTAEVYGRDPSNLASFNQFIAGNVYDCFTDGQFVNLPASGASNDYQVKVYAYNETAYLAAGDARIRAAAANPGDLPATNPTLSTLCVAQQIQDVQTLAVCPALTAGSSGAAGTSPADAAAPTATIALPVTTFARADGGVLTCDTDYTTVRYRPSVGGTLGAVVTSRCNVAVTVSPAVAPATYAIDVALLNGDGGAVGQTTCGADTSPGLTSTAVCKPVQ